MSLEEDILIEKFLNGMLSKVEQEAFLKRMNTDLEFNKIVSLERQLQETLSDKDWSFINRESLEVKEYEEAFKSEEVKAVKKVIENVNTAYQKSNKTNYRRNWIFYASAAVIAMTIAISVFYPKSSPQKLYIAYLEESQLPSFISREDSNENNLIRAQQFFENKEYEKALIIFKRELEISGSPDGALYLYTGIAQLELDAYTEAEKTFNKLISSDLIDAQKGKWYKALLYLKMERLNDLRSLLDEIIQQKLYNYKKAEELLKKL